MVKKILNISSLAIIVSAAVIANSSAAVIQAKILVPAYFYPGVDGNENGTDDWQDMADASKTIEIIAVMNPSSGSGGKSDINYVNAVNKLRSNGGKVIGYLSTQRGERPMATLNQQIKNYINWYKVDGFFFDEMPSAHDMSILTAAQRTANYNYYTTLYSTVKKLVGHNYVLGNPGNIANARFLDQPTTNALVTLENDATKQTVVNPPPAGAIGYTPAVWQLASPHVKSQFALILHNVSTASKMQAIVNAGIPKGFGLYYVTDDSNVDSNPFDRLPKYWGAFVTKIKNTSYNQ